jgi:hypothetical protein
MTTGVSHAASPPQGAQITGVAAPVEGVEVPRTFTPGGRR